MWNRKGQKEYIPRDFSPMAPEYSTLKGKNKLFVQNNIYLDKFYINFEWEIITCLSMGITLIILGICLAGKALEKVTTDMQNERW